MKHTTVVGLCVVGCTDEFVVFACHCGRCEDRQLHRGAMRFKCWWCLSHYKERWAAGYYVQRSAAARSVIT